MTESEWLGGSRPLPLLLWVRYLVSERKVLLFNCACCRRVWSQLDAEDRSAIVEAEDTADDLTAAARLQARLHDERRANLAIHGLIASPVPSDLRTLVTTRTFIRQRLDGSRGYGIGALAFDVVRMSSTPEAEEAAQSNLVRCVVGNPFRPVVADPDWLTSTVIALARGVYEERAFDRLPILADALEDAGCENEDVLNHCRGENVHVRGCWVLDLVLGKG